MPPEYCGKGGINALKWIRNELHYLKNKLQEWEWLWDMEFNPSKCQVLHIAWSRKPINRNYTMHGQVRESVEHARYLAVEISSDLKFSHHINRVTANASKSLGFLKRNIKTKQAAYKTVVRPQLEYASSNWSPYTKKDIYKVEMVQRRAIRWSPNSYSSYQSVTELQQQSTYTKVHDPRPNCLKCFP